LILEIKKYKFVCDNCGYDKIIEQINNNYPKDWGTKEIHDCGSTGYTKTDHICPSCFAGLKTKRLESFLKLGWKRIEDILPPLNHLVEWTVGPMDFTQIGWYDGQDWIIKNSKVKIKYIPDLWIERKI
jgi:ssDNA-binding Zn-finger/Zn-ribbon topoisomerase 1